MGTINIASAHLRRTSSPPLAKSRDSSVRLYRGRRPRVWWRQFKLRPAPGNEDNSGNNVGKLHLHLDRNGFSQREDHGFNERYRRRGVTIETSQAS
jgi:hypothetical protein